MDRKYTQVVEVTTSGALVQKIDVSAVGMKNPAAITLAPASNDPARTDLYVTTRGVDNDGQPTENDGVMYELSAPDLGPVNQGGNTAPQVSAGTDATVTLPATAALDGTVTDDGLPNPPGATTATWTKASGPGAVTFGDSHAVDTTASFSLPGTYVLRLSATDGALTTADDVTITVLSATPGNTAPSVNAGPDQSVVLPASASLQGTVSDDGLPDPPGVTTVSWSKVSGPGTVSFSAPASPTTTASFGAAGTYLLRLTASDSALSASDDVTVVASTAPVSGNLVPNPGFEAGATGWNASGGTLTRVSPGHTGSYAARLANTGTGTATCQLNDHPDTVASTAAGRYTAGMWVLGAAAAGSTATLRVREYAGSTLVGTTEAKLVLSTGWQQVSLTHTVVSPGSHLDLTLRRSTPAGQTCFTVDDVAVSRT